MGKLSSEGPRRPFKKSPKRHPDGDGLFFRVAGQGKAYFTARYTVGHRERETSLGPYPETSLDEARVKHLDLRASLARKVHPVAERNVKAAPPAGRRPSARWPTATSPPTRAAGRTPSITAMGNDPARIRRADPRPAGRQGRRQGGA